MSLEQHQVPREAGRRWRNADDVVILQAVSSHYQQYVTIGVKGMDRQVRDEFVQVAEEIGFKSRRAVASLA
jgi:hypothetical protein